MFVDNLMGLKLYDRIDLMGLNRSKRGSNCDWMSLVELKNKTVGY